MFKLVVLMILVVILLSFFGSALLNFLNLLSGGFALLSNALIIPIDFISRAFFSLFSYYNITNILVIFLCVSLILIIIKFLRGVDFKD